MENETLKALTALTRKKSAWLESLPFVTSALSEPSDKVRYKALFLIGEMGFAQPAQIDDDLMNEIVSVWSDPDERLRAQAACAAGRIGRSDYRLILPHLENLLSVLNDESEKVRMNVIWACENIATEHAELFENCVSLFAAMLDDKAEYVRMEAPEIFRVLGKRKPAYVVPYLDKLQKMAETDSNRVARIHAAGAVKATEQALLHL